jgi:NO-binding membrane sensor protein with MHYT domain
MRAYRRPGMVVLSIVVAIVASYAALDLAGQVAVAVGRSPIAWLGSGAGVLGSGIWAVQFVAMLAFYLLPPIPAIRAEAF